MARPSGEILTSAVAIFFVFVISISIAKFIRPEKSVPFSGRQRFLPLVEMTNSFL
jgi:hypothetical protein